MIQQLVFTSAPKGLNPNSRGFTTVAATRGMTPPLISRLENMSSYKLAFNLSDERSSLNPVAYSHTVVELASQSLHVLSRVAPAGADYSDRSNTLAHHLVVEPDRIPTVGPIDILANPGSLLESWSGAPRYLDDQPTLPSLSMQPQTCKAWDAVMGDAGWGGVLPAASMAAAHRPAYLIYEPGTDVISLIGESLALMPAKQQWSITFNTYFTSAAPGTKCLWRCVLAGSDAAKAISGGASTVVVDLTKRTGQLPTSPFVDAARAGMLVEPAKTRVTRSVPSVSPHAATPVSQSTSRDTTLAAEILPETSSPYELETITESALPQTGESQFAHGDDSPDQFTREPVRRTGWMFIGFAAMLLLGVGLGYVMAGLLGEKAPVADDSKRSNDIEVSKRDNEKLVEELDAARTRRDTLEEKNTELGDFLKEKDRLIGRLNKQLKEKEQQLLAALDTSGKQGPKIKAGSSDGKGNSGKDSPDDTIKNKVETLKFEKLEKFEGEIVPDSLSTVSRRLEPPPAPIEFVPFYYSVLVDPLDGIGFVTSTSEKGRKLQIRINSRDLTSKSGFDIRFNDTGRGTGMNVTTLGTDFNKGDLENMRLGLLDKDKKNMCILYLTPEPLREIRDVPPLNGDKVELIINIGNERADGVAIADGWIRKGDTYVMSFSRGELGLKKDKTSRWILKYPKSKRGLIWTTWDNQLEREHMLKKESENKKKKKVPKADKKKKEEALEKLKGQIEDIGRKIDASRESFVSEQSDYPKAIDALKPIRFVDRFQVPIATLDLKAILDFKPVPEKRR